MTHHQVRGTNWVVSKYTNLEFRFYVKSILEKSRTLIDNVLFLKSIKLREMDLVEFRR